MHSQIMMYQSVIAQLFHKPKRKHKLMQIAAHDHSTKIAQLLLPCRKGKSRAVINLLYAANDGERGAGGGHAPPPQLLRKKKLR
jgi:hypothetical protein